MLETKNLYKHFGGVYAVENVSLKFEKGMITALVGPNGSGKSTLVNVLSGLLDIDHGTVIVRGATLTKLIPEEISSFGITRTFQSVRLFEQMPVLDNILLVLTERNPIRALFEKHSEYHLKTAEEILKKLNLLEKKNELAKNLSYGQRKLLEIGRVLAMRAEIVLLDEPFTGLFHTMSKIVEGILLAMKQAGKTVILIEHDMGLIRRITDYVFVLDSGKLLAEGKPEEVLARREVIEAYLGE